MHGLGRFLGTVTFSVLLAGCAAVRYHHEGLDQVAEGKIEEGLANLARASKEDPDNARFRSDLLNIQAEQINRLLAAADAERTARKWDDAERLYKRVLAIAPANSRAAEGIDAMMRDRRHAPIIERAKDAFKKGDFDRATELLSLVVADSPSDPNALALQRQIEEQRIKEQLSEPVLHIGQKKPITLEFRDANLKIVLEALSRSTGVNFILDKDVRPDLRTTIFLRHASLEDAIELILQTNRLEKKVLNRNTILIYPNNPDKLKEYQELVVKGFYLSNADVKQTQAMLKTMLKTKDIYIDEKLNLLIMRDTPDAIRLASKLIAMHDLYEPEVMLDVEVLEVQRSHLLDLGIQFPNQITLTPLTSNPAKLSDLRHLNSDRIGVTVPSATVNLRSDVGDVNILANPRIRARNREKAKIMIGDKLPVVTTTTTATGVTSENVQYLDVGIKLDVEPNVYLEDEVAIKIGLEVSTIVNEVKTPLGSLAYQLGSRSASTVLRLKDGETQVLAGLINDEDRMAASRVPGIGDLPIVGRLFSSQQDNHNKTEIVLAITPHLIRNINRPDAAASEFWTGTEATLRTKPVTLQVVRADNAAGADKQAGEVSHPDEADEVAANTGPTNVALSLQGPSHVKVGDEFKVALHLKADGGMRSLPFQLGFDSAAFQVVNVTEGGYFKQNDVQTSFSSNVDPGAGKAFVSVVRSGTKGARGEGDVAVLTLRALAAKPDAQVRLLSTTPIAVGGKTVAPSIPAPLSISVDN
jgi:general secretion pathway protein D